MNSSKKILLLAFVVTMLLTMSMVASAATITVGTATVDQGTATTVAIPITITDNADYGLCGLDIVLVSDATVKKIVQEDEALSTLDCTRTPATKSIIWDAIDNDYDEGLAATVTFNVPAEAGEYTIDVTVNNAYYLDENWDPVDADITVVPGKITVKGAAPAATLEATGKSLLLDGGIDAKVYFAYNGTDTLKINGVAAASDAKGYYGYVSVSPKDYADTVTFTATASDVDDVVVTTSVAAIIDEYQATATGTLKTLVDALEVYCAQANAYFNGGSADAVSATVSAATPSIENKAIDGISFNSTSLILRDKVVLRHYFNITAETDLAAYGVTLVKLDDTHAYVEYANINAAELANVITTTLTKGETMTIDFAPLAYADLMQDDAELGNLVKALYLYSVAAAAYAA